VTASIANNKWIVPYPDLPTTPLLFKLTLQKLMFWMPKLPKMISFALSDANLLFMDITLITFSFWQGSWLYYICWQKCMQAVLCSYYCFFFMPDYLIYSEQVVWKHLINHEYKMQFWVGTTNDKFNQDSDFRLIHFVLFVISKNVILGYLFLPICWWLGYHSFGIVVRVLGIYF